MKDNCVTCVPKMETLRSIVRSDDSPGMGFHSAMVANGGQDINSNIAQGGWNQVGVIN